MRNVQLTDIVKQVLLDKLTNNQFSANLATALAARKDDWETYRHNIGP